MRLFLISLLSLFFLSGCGEKDPAEEFIGKWNFVGGQGGIVIHKDGKGIKFSNSTSKRADGGTVADPKIESFTWTLKEDDEGAFLDTEEVVRLGELRFYGPYLESTKEAYGGTLIFERAK